MTVCYFGTYNPKYPRNHVLIEGLRKNRVNVIECNSRRPWVLKYFSLGFQLLLKARRADAIVVGFPMGRGVVKLLRCFILCKGVLQYAPTDGMRKTSVIIDGFVSQYDAEVFDRKHLAEDSQEAKKLFQWEQSAFRFASKVLVDTKANAEYYSKLFSIPRDHFVVIPVGTDEELFKPSCHPEPVEGLPNEDAKEVVRPQMSTGHYAHHDNKDIIVHFCGTYNPLQGIDVITRAIQILKDQPIYFRLVGRGEEYEKIVVLAKELDVFSQIEFIDRVPYDEYARLMSSADICLGIFSDSAKAGRVIPNKVVESMACGKAIITADSPAIRELLTNGESALLCKPNDPKDLAQKIVELYQNELLRLKLGKNARKVFLETLTTEKIGKSLLKSIFESNE